MSSTALKIFAAVSVLAAIVLAAIGYRMSREYAQKSETAQQQVQQQKAEQTLAVVAVKPLAAYKPIARDAVALVPVSVKPAEPFTTIDDVVGKQPLIDIDAGAPVTRRYFREGNLLARAIPAGYKAVSISVTDVLAVGGFLRPGDIVDVLLYLRGTGGHDGIEQPQARLLLKNVRVLAYLEQVVDRPAGVDDDKNQQHRQPQRTAVLAIPDKDTTRLMLGASLGDLRLAMHGQADEDATMVAAAETSTTAAPSAATDGTPTKPGEPAAKDASKDADKTKNEDDVITSAELGRIKAPPKHVVPRARVEIIRGDDRSAVTTR
ncbi:Flp pilus assembly protein CpaB [Solimonas marina]|uniref:Flp pilus assembly protein CpaB n=1 Tax=Solimonas marina TaxID=2714601 RepID=A0A969W7J9_9GAMM|nr:Flp pilus assembly protein CpaB [Solimonas marina]NKF21418.1 Flp pilus assembly protein CpaB [Solimonas marina]